MSSQYFPTIEHTPLRKFHSLQHIDKISSQLPFPYNIQDSILGDLVKKIKHKEHGFPVKDRKKFFKTYKLCFTGKQAVEWLLKHEPGLTKHDGVNTPKQRAILLCQLLLDLGCIQSVTKDHRDFSDSKIFYRFTKYGQSDKELWKDVSKLFKRLNEMRVIVQNVMTHASFLQVVRDFTDIHNGVPVKDRNQGNVVYKHCFVASEAIDWISKKYGVSRRSAVKMAEIMRKVGCFESLSKQAYFEDNDTLWKLKPFIPKEVNLFKTPKTQSL